MAITVPRERPTFAAAPVPVARGMPRRCGAATLVAGATPELGFAWRGSHRSRLDSPEEILVRPAGGRQRRDARGDRAVAGATRLRGLPGGGRRGGGGVPAATVVRRRRHRPEHARA